jgi:REP element-mobilizing transposase RayT
MARLARMVIPGLPHHVTQRGNRREAIFFENGVRPVLDRWPNFRDLLL